MSNQGRRRDRDRALVRNAADPRQVQRAGQLERDREERMNVALREVLASPAGRLVLGELLERAGLFRTSFDPSGSMMYFREGRRNFGLEIQAALDAAAPDLFDLLERERRTRRQLEDRETDAAHTPRAEQQGASDDDGSK
jgi:hypothetical protein